MSENEDVGIIALRDKIDAWHLVRAEIDELKGQIDDLNKKLSPMTSEILKIMETLELKNFQGSKGKVSLVTVDYVNNPKTEADKEAFYGYLKEEGIFEEMVSVHHQKLNSFFKERLEAAVENGEELNIPGLELQQRQELRKGR